jgi:hypothetical protein
VFTDDSEDDPDPDQLKEDLDLVETALADPEADEILPVTPPEIPAVNPSDDDEEQ